MFHSLVTDYKDLQSATIKQQRSLTDWEKE